MGVLGSGSIAAAEGNSLSLAPAARASSLAREPWGRIAGVARTDNNLSAEKISRLHESFNTWLPLGRRVGGVLPKAEGVAFHTAGILSVAGILTVRRTAMK